MQEYNLKYFYLKLGQGNKLADYWLNKDNCLSKPLGVIYFGEERINDIPKAMVPSNLFNEVTLLFYNLLLNDTRSNIRFVTLSKKFLYITKPTSNAYDLPKKAWKIYDEYLEEYPDLQGYRCINEDRVIINVPKVVDLSVELKESITKVPSVISTMSCNQRYTRGTLREINDSGNIRALNILLGKVKGNYDLSPSDLIELLGPYEIETLVFLILLNSGLHVSSWRGGTLKGIDIIATNLNYSDISIGPVKFIHNKPVSFQVKRTKVDYNDDADWYIGIEGEGERVLDANWILSNAYNQKNSKQWLKDSLRWVPNIENLIP